MYNVETLPNDLNNVVRWTLSNRMILNYSKTKSMLFGTIQQLKSSILQFNMQLDGKNIDRITNFNYLDVCLDEALTWNSHIDIMSSKVNKRLGLIFRIRSCLTINASKCVYNSLIQPILSYTDTVQRELSARNSKCLQCLQNRASRIITNRSSYKETIQILGWVDLSTNRDIHKCILVYKCSHNLEPANLSNYFIRNNRFHSYNTRHKNYLHLPKPRLSLGTRTFRYTGSILFNSLPVEIQEAFSLNIFKNRIKKHFLAKLPC